MADQRVTPGARIARVPLRGLRGIVPLRGLRGVVAAGILLAATAVGSGCARPPLWPRKNDLGGRCRFHKDIPRFDIAYTWGEGGDRATLRIGWLGALVEWYASGPLHPAHTTPRCLDHDTLAELYRRTVAVLPRVEDTFAPEGAAVLDGGWSEWIELIDEGKTRNVAWLSKGPGKEWGLPPKLRELVAYYDWFAQTLSSREGSPPLDRGDRKAEFVPPERLPDVYEPEPPGTPPPPTPGPPGPSR